MGPVFDSASRSLLKSGLLPVDRCGTCQETISRRLQHTYTPSHREGPLYKSVLKKCKGVQTVATIQVISGPLLNSGLRCLFRYGTHQMINGRLELVHLPSDLILEWPGEGPLFQLELKKCRGQYVGTIRVIPWAIIYVKFGTLGQVSHQCKSLSYVVLISLSNLLKIMYLLTSKKIEGSLSKHLCL